MESRKSGVLHTKKSAYFINNTGQESSSYNFAWHEHAYHYEYFKLICECPAWLSTSNLEGR